MPKKKHDEEDSELEEEIESEIDSEELQRQLEELQEDFNTERFQEFLQSSGDIPVASLNRINQPRQIENLEQDMTFTSTAENKREQRGYVERLEDTGIDYRTQEPENLESARPVQVLMRENILPTAFAKRQRLTADTELEQLGNPQSEKGEYIIDVENVEMERHLPFEDPKRRYKEKPIR